MDIVLVDVGPRVVFDETELAVKPHGFRGQHARPVTADAAIAVAVWTGQEVHIGRGEDFS